MKLLRFIFIVSFFVSSLQALEPASQQTRSPESLKVLASKVLATKTELVDQLIDADPTEAQEIIEITNLETLDTNAQETIKHELIKKIEPQFGKLVRLEKEFDYGNRLYSAALMQNDTHLLLASYGAAKIVDLATGKCLMELPHSDYVYAITVNHDNTRALTISADKCARLWDLSTGKQILSPLRHNGAVYSAEFNHDGSHALTASSDNTVKYWDLSTGHWKMSYSHNDRVKDAVFSHNDAYILTGCRNGTAKFLELSTGRELLNLLHKGCVRSVAFNHNDSHALTASEDKTAKIWDLSTGICLFILPHTEFVKSAIYNQDDSRVLICGYYTVNFWNPTTGKRLFSLLHDKEVRSAVFNHDETRILTASDDGIARFWLLPKGILQSMSLPAVALLLKLKQHGPLILESDFYQKLHQGLTPAEQEIIKPYLKRNIQDPSTQEST